MKFAVDYFDVFSPVTKWSTLRVLLALIAAQDLELKHVDDAMDVILSTYDATGEGDASYLRGMAITRDRLRRTLKLVQTACVD